MKIKCALAAAALSVAGSASASANTFSGHQFDHNASNTFAWQSKSKKHFEVSYDESTGDSNRVHSYSASANHNEVNASVPEPETYALMIAGLLVVFSVARRRRDRS